MYIAIFQNGKKSKQNVFKLPLVIILWNQFNNTVIVTAVNPYLMSDAKILKVLDFCYIKTKR